MRYPSVTDSESGHDRLLITVECVSSVAQTFKFGSVSNSLFLASLFHSFCQIVSMYITILGFRSDQHICERAVKLDGNAAFASPSALSCPEMPTCEGIHAMTTWTCGGNFLSRL